VIGVDPSGRGIAEATLLRWHNETQIQSRAMDNLLRVFFAFPEVRAALNKVGREPGEIAVGSNT
jgi:hypothetical protein